MFHHQILPTGSFGVNCSVLWNDEAKRCWIVDPGQDADDIIAFLSEKGLEPELVVFTHAHFDHIGAMPGLLVKWPTLPVHVGPKDEPMLGNPLNSYEPEYPCVPRPATLVADLEEGVVLSAAGISARILSTPGHTPGGVCVYFETEGLLLSGDTLFAGSCGRTDFPGGSMKAMAASLHRLATLPPQTVVVPGHGMTTTIEREVASNPFMER